MKYTLHWVPRVGDRVEYPTSRKGKLRISRGRVTRILGPDVLWVRGAHLKYDTEVYLCEIRPVGRVTALSWWDKRKIRPGKNP